MNEYAAFAERPFLAEASSGIGDRNPEGGIRRIEGPEWWGSRPSRVPLTGDVADRFASGSGTPLDSATRQSMERRFHTDFGEVRLHTGQDAAAVTALYESPAVAIGARLFFAPDKYAPASRAGQRLLAHELAHVMQQRRAMHGSGDSNSAIDAAAEESAQRLATGASAVPVRGAATPGVWRAPADKYQYEEPSSPAPGEGEEMRLESIVEAEFRSLPKGMIANAKSPSAYAKLVRRFFGSYRSYYDFAKESDAELDEPIGTEGKLLRTYIQRKGLPGHAQTVFYRWVRKAYMRRGLDHIAMILAQGGGEIAIRMAQAGEDAGEEIIGEGFNPRPMKSTADSYVLGTLSKHGSGEAADIDPRHNLFVSNAAWQYIERQTGVRVDTSKARWRDHPGELYDDIARLSDRWADQAQRLVATEKLREKRASHHKAMVLRALRDVPDMADEQKIQSVNGLMKLPKAVVLALREQGLLWGVTFPSGKDIMHFEVRADFPGKPKRD
jgi:hypothetical protein